LITVDCLGRACPIPVIELAKAILTVDVGQVVEVLSDDPAARIDIPAWCRMRAQEYVGEEPREIGTAYLVRRVS
jgi:cysteine desulfurase